MLIKCCNCVQVGGNNFAQHMSLDTEIIMALLMAACVVAERRSFTLIGLETVLEHKILPIEISKLAFIWLIATNIYTNDCIYT